VLLLLVGLAACGGGGGDAVSPLPPPPPLAFNPADASQVNQSILGQPTGAKEVVTAVHPNGEVILVVYIQPDAQGVNNVFARQMDPGGNLGPQQLIGVEGSGAARALRVKFGPNGRAIAIWEQRVSTTQDTEVRARVFTGGAWAANSVRLHSLLALGTSALQPDLAFDTSGNAVAVWSQRLLLGGILNVKLVSATLGGAASATDPWITTDVTSSASAFFDESPRVVATPGPNLAGTFVVVALEKGGVRDGKLVAYRCAYDHTDVCLPGGTSGVEIPMAVGNLDGTATGFDVAANSNGDMVVSWRHDYDGSGRRGAWMTYLPNTKSGLGSSLSWRPAQALDTGGESLTSGVLVGDTPSAQVMADGTVLVAWPQFTANDPADPPGTFVKRLRPTAAGPMAADPAVRVDTGETNLVKLALGRDGKGKALLLWNSEDHEESLFWSALDPTAAIISPSSRAPVNPVLGNSKVVEGAGFAAALGPDGKGVAVWMQANPSTAAMVNRLK
jgi:hypothetical protein